ncbi:helix-turn-helix domain-containing protein [Streptomyces sp. SID13726]|uniref:helix-turn-helix domain-containing protein n=1 Tax=Streptomyces sp. SID13726 TaxID=2706058 RepID=UPI0013BAFB7D|nr:helix-turn-helix domain-containing protein [Streptomyces sp. SID13726]NEB03728.1 helix-turn-helix domain-containing protein [Streptomyces sp. SID13726]
MHVVSTAEVAVGEAFAFWREANSKLWAPYHLRCEPRLDSGCRTQVCISEFEPAQATRMITMPHSIHLTPKLIRQADLEVLTVCCFVHGNGMITQDGRSAEVDIGDLVLYLTSRPHLPEVAPDFSDSRLLLLRFPCSFLPLPARDLRRPDTGRLPSAQGISALSSQFLLNLARHLHELSPSDTARLAILTLDILTTALANALDTPSTVPRHTRQRALMAQIHAFIRDNLSDTRLTPDAIATAHHISLRYLHKLFHQEGHTVAGWIRERRLEQCRRDLANTGLASRPIHAIAARWGFTSPAHFSQAFRSAYGLSPRQFRQHHATVHAD